jgi:hypothetical protein
MWGAHPDQTRRRGLRFRKTKRPGLTKGAPTEAVRPFFDAPSARIVVFVFVAGSWWPDSGADSTVLGLAAPKPNSRYKKPSFIRCLLIG